VKKKKEAIIFFYHMGSLRNHQLHLAELVLTLNCFSFADNYSKQINGVAMGTKMGPSYASLFVGYIKEGGIGVFGFAVLAIF